MAEDKSTSRAPEELLLDDLLISLQKAFSRLSRASARVTEDSARALITGDVEFELTFKADAEEDHIYPQQDGFIGITLRGTIETDIRLKDEGSEDPDAR